MKMNHIKRTLAVILALLMILVSVPAVSATEDVELSGNYKLGEVLVSLKTGSPSVNNLLPGFEIESVRLLTPGSDHTVYHIIFVEKTKAIVQKAITMLNASPFVDVAEPNYIGEYLPVIEPTTQPSESETDNNELVEEYEVGVVLVSLKSGAPSIKMMLSDFEIESVRLLTPGSSSTVYRVTFVEKNKEIVQAAITALKASPFVISAEPNYIGQYLPVEEPTTQPTESTAAENELDEDYELGAVLVSLKSGSPSIESLLSGFEIESVRLLTPGSDRTVYHVTFAEKSEVIVQAAITALKASPFIISAEPNYIGQYLPVEDPTTQPTESTNPSVGLMKGDADGDGEVTILDATVIQRTLVSIPVSFIDEAAADADGDGEVTVLDATVIQRKLVGIIENW